MQNGDTTYQTMTSERRATQQAAPPEECHVLGIYSVDRTSKMGLGSTARSYKQKTWWFVRRLNDETYSIQALNSNSIPSGPITHVSKGDFMRSYHPEPGYYEKRCIPFITSLKKKIVQAEKHLAEDDLSGAEKEFCKALLLDEKHPKANVELGKIYLKKGDGKKLAAALRRILNIDALFQEQERHLFNEFGICLRKQKRFAEAISFYRKAVERNDADEHLHFNIARALVEAGEIDEAKGHLNRAIALRDDFPEAKRFLEYIDRTGKAPSDADLVSLDVTPPDGDPAPAAAAPPSEIAL